MVQQDLLVSKVWQATEAILEFKVELEQQDWLVCKVLLGTMASKVLLV